MRAIETTFSANQFNKSGLTINLRRLNKILMAMALSVFVYYLISTNYLAVKSFALKDLNQQIDKLTQENINLEVQTISLSAYGGLSQKMGELGWTKVNDIKYLKAEMPTMAKK